MNVQRMLKMTSYDTNPEDTTDPTGQQQDEWMFLCRLQPTFPQSPNSSQNIDWEEDAAELLPTLLQSCPNWIKQKKSQSDGLHRRTNQPTSVEVNNLNQEQLKALLVSRHFANHDQGAPLCMLTAGTSFML